MIQIGLFFKRQAAGAELFEQMPCLFGIITGINPKLLLTRLFKYAMRQTQLPQVATEQTEINICADLQNLNHELLLNLLGCKWGLVTKTSIIHDRGERFASITCLESRIFDGIICVAGLKGTLPFIKGNVPFKHKSDHGKRTSTGTDSTNALD